MNFRLLHAALVSAALIATACGGDTAGVPSNNNGTVVIDAGNNGVDDAANNGVDDTGGELACDQNGDCTPPDVCVFDLETGAGTCGDPAGNGQTGDACTTGDDCQSGLCVNGLCADGCQSESDCPAGYTCGPADVQLVDGTIVSIDVCVPEAVPCVSNSGCNDPDVCVVDRSGDGLSLQCNGPVGGGDLGDSCAADTECASGLCLDGECSAPCETSNDCATDGSFICENATLSTGGADADLTVCRPRPEDQCLSDAQCPGNDRCVADKTATDLEFSCGTANAGGAEIGGSCTADADCAQNLCVGGTCSGPCQSVGDCSTGTDFTCRVTMVDIGGGITDSAQVCVAPVSCDDSDDCRTAMGEVCYVRETPADLDTVCRQANVGGGDLGQVCARDRECSNNFCLETRFRDVCATPCADNADCAVNGYECQSLTVDLAGGGTDSVSMCVPSAPAPCTSENDCSTGLDCVVIENTAGNGLEAVCVPTTGGLATGVACTGDDECASLVCLDGFCAAPCDDDNQCGQDQLCISSSVTKNNNSANFDLCDTLSPEACTSSDDCSDGIRVCSDVQTTMGVDSAFCEFPNVGGTQLGETCAASSECRENICLNGLSNECSVVCDKDADCGAAQECTTFGALNFCNSACTDNSDCAARGNICTINGDDISNEVDQICTEPVGANDLGALCATGGDCNTGLCLRTLAFSTMCTIDGDCAAGETCECPVDNPNCTVGKECATVERRCTALCDDPTDCATGVMGNELTECSPDTFVQRPDGTSTRISTCSRP